ncbi:hypothetical protein MMC22_010635 [Lobaria immixta]|nr:hypothetical protein [Lobaria immixta]
MAAAISALNAKIRSQPVLSYFCSTHFWGPASNFGIPIAAVMDTKKDAEIHAEKPALVRMPLYKFRGAVDPGGTISTVLEDRRIRLFEGIEDCDVWSGGFAALEHRSGVTVIDEDCYGGREESLRIKAETIASEGAEKVQEGSREVIQKGKQTLTDAKEALKK